MHQINRRVGFQQVAPRPLTGMGFARYQQHPQPVAHAVDLDHGGIIAVGQLARCRRKAELQHVHPAMGQGDRQAQILAGRHLKALRRSAVDGQRQVGQTGHPRRHRTLIVDPQRQRHRLADDGKGRGVLDDQPPVPIVRLAGQQHMQRRGHRGGQRHIMDLTIGDQDCPRHPGARFLGQQLRQRRQHQRPAIVGRIGDGDGADLYTVHRRQFGGDPRQCRVDLRRAGGDFLAGGLIDHHQHDVALWCAILGLQAGVGQSGQQRRQRQPA